MPLFNHSLFNHSLSNRPTLARDISIVLVIKIIIILTIKHIWFDPPKTSSTDNIDQTSQHLLGQPTKEQP